MTPIDGAATEEVMRLARRRWVGGVAVVLTRDGSGHRGATVTSFAVVSLTPPLVLVCLDREGRVSSLVTGTGAFAVSILDRRQQILADRFAGRAPLPDASLSGIAHEPGTNGNPVLAGALAWFDCRVHAVHDGGDHLIVVGAVDAVGIGPETDDPLLYYEGRYRGIEPA